MDVDTLKAAIADGLSIDEAAEVLEREIDEVIEKCRELKLHTSSSKSGGGLEPTSAADPVPTTRKR